VVLNWKRGGAQVDGVSRVQLSRTLYNFTDTQDVRVLVGYRTHVDAAGRSHGVRALLNPGKSPASPACL